MGIIDLTSKHIYRYLLSDTTDCKAFRGRKEYHYRLDKSTTAAPSLPALKLAPFFNDDGKSLCLSFTTDDYETLHSKLRRFRTGAKGEYYCGDLNTLCLDEDIEGFENNKILFIALVRRDNSQIMVSIYDQHSSPSKKDQFLFWQCLSSSNSN